MGAFTPPPLPAWADFSITMECTPQFGRCHSMYFVFPTMTALDYVSKDTLYTVHCEMDLYSEELAL
jgi:hypothetical protein